MEHFLIELLKGIRFIVQIFSRLFQRVMNCFSFAVLFCVVCQNGWLPWLVKGNVSAEDFQNFFASVLVIYSVIYVVKLPFLLIRLGEGGLDN